MVYNRMKRIEMGSGKYTEIKKSGIIVPTSHRNAARETT